MSSSRDCPLLAVCPALIFAYLYSHRNSVLLIDEPDAHLEILRQKQVYVLLREIAAENESQVVMVTHSEVVLAESLERNLTLLLEGQADDLAARTDILNALKYYGAEHYMRARQRGYVLYVEGRTDVEMLRAFARRLNHRAANSRDERANVFYVMSNFPNPDLDAEHARVEGGFNTTPKEHFFALRELVPGLRGLAILDNRLGHATLLRKGEFHRLVDLSDPASFPEEVSEKLDLLAELFDKASPGESA